MKLYTENGEFILEKDNGTKYASPQQDVIISNAFPPSAGVSYIIIYNLEGWSSKAILSIEDLSNKDGIPYNPRTFEQFKDSLEKEQFLESKIGDFYYQTWVEQGNEGTREEFLQQLLIKGDPLKFEDLTESQKKELRAGGTKNSTYSTVLKFDDNKYNRVAKTQTGTINYTLSNTGNLDGVVIRHKVISDGVNSIIFSNDFNVFNKSDDNIYPSGEQIIYFNYIGGQVDVVIPTYQKGSSSTPTNTAPTDITLSSNSVDEDATNDTLVGILSTTDTEGGSMTYSITAQQIAGAFKIVGNELQVANTNQIVYTNNTTLTVDIRVTDDGGLTYDKQFTITVNEAGVVLTPEYVVWTDLVKATDEGNGTIRINSGDGNNYDEGGIGTKAINGDNSLTFTIPLSADGTIQALGLSTSNGIGIEQDIVIITSSQDEFYLIHEDGSNVYPSTDFTGQPEFEFVISGSTVSVKVNGSTVYTSGKNFNPSSNPLNVVMSGKYINSSDDSSIINAEFQNSNNLTAKTI